MTTTLRTLPRIVQPGAGETFHSWLTRFADLLDYSPAEMHAAIGYNQASTRQGIPGYGFIIREEEIKNISHTSRVPREKIERTLLGTFNDGPLAFGTEQLTDASSMRQLGLSNWLYSGTSTLCSQCLQDNGHQWQLAWRLPWTFACTRHAVIHEHRCPACATPFNAGRRRDAALGPLHPSLVPDHRRCANSDPTADNSRSPRPELCRHAYVETAHVATTSDAILQAQVIINERLRRERSESEREWWSDARAIASILFAHGNPEIISRAVTPISERSLDAIACYYQKRDQGRQEREMLQASGVDHRRTSRRRAYMATPENPHLFAPVATIAISVADLSRGTDSQNIDTEQTLRDLQSLLRERKNSLGNALIDRKTSRHLKALVSELGQRNLLVARNAEFRSKHRLDPNNIPRLWPADKYEEIAELMGTQYTEYGRRFISLALVKAALACTWNQAAGHLAWVNPHRGSKVGNANNTRLANNGNATAISEYIRRMLTELALGERTTNYRRLESRIASYSSRHMLTCEQWAVINSQAGTALGATENRRRCANLWAWNTIASAPIAEWPGMKTVERPDMLRSIYVARFKKLELPRIVGPLTRHWTNVLDSPWLPK